MQTITQKPRYVFSLLPIFLQLFFLNPAWEPKQHLKFVLQLTQYPNDYCAHYMDI